MNYATIKYNDIANGLGVRTSLFVSGCTHYCKGCFNSEAWDFAYGQPFTKDVEDQILNSLQSEFNDGLSLLGGEPFEPQNQAVLLPFLKRVRKAFPNKSIWCYTGFVFDENTGALKETHKNTPITKDLIALFDVLVDGPFIEEQKNIRLKFRGSENQRVIDVQKTLALGKCVLYME